VRYGTAFLATLSVATAIHLAMAPPASADAWCGTDRATQDRKPDMVAGYQVHVIYAVPNDQPERFSANASLITTDVGAVDAWWRREDPMRTVRFDLAAFPCATTFGALDISYASLPRGTAAYGTDGGRENRALQDDLNLLGFTDPGKKYLVYYDGATNVQFCGFSPSLFDRGGAYADAVVFTRSSVFCGVLGGGLTGYPAASAAHELIHNFGAVQNNAPHVCPNEGHICNDGSDIMSSAPGFNALAKAFLDPGHDDYYGHPGAWWDVRDSPWLIRRDVQTFPLSVAIAGSGTGDVTSDVPGVSCATLTCATTWEAGSVVQLKASPSAGSLFTGWSGACSGSAACSVTIGGPTTVAARFDKSVVLTAAVDQSRASSGGTLRSDPAGIDCPGFTCASAFAQGSTVSLIAKPWSGYRVDSWGGVCADHAETCVVTIDTAKTVTVSFGPASRHLAVRVQGQGKILRNESGEACAGRCVWIVDVDTSLTLTAKPAKGWRLRAWSGACTGHSPSCAVDMTEDVSANAVFMKAPAPKCRPAQKSTRKSPCRR
jgi:hypothetical protein